MHKKKGGKTKKNAYQGEQNRTYVSINILSEKLKLEKIKANV